MVSAVRLESVEPLHREAYQLAVDARDPRFDGVFFVGITTTRVYCRPVCPSRLAYDRHRRFFDSAAAAERAGFRPCLRCRPELAPGRAGRAVLDAVSRLARAAAQRIAAGALNGHNVADLASELGVSERHLRRALEHEIGVSPLELAQTHRLLLAKRLLVDTDLPVTRVAYASGFQSLRRFNAAFREQYGRPPSALRRGVPPRRPASLTPPAAESLGLALAPRAAPRRSTTGCARRLRHRAPRAHGSARPSGRCHALPRRARGGGLGRAGRHRSSGPDAPRAHRGAGRGGRGDPPRDAWCPVAAGGGAYGARGRGGERRAPTRARKRCGGDAARAGRGRRRQRTARHGHRDARALLAGRLPRDRPHAPAGGRRVERACAARVRGAVASVARVRSAAPLVEDGRALR